ncbi:MAG: gamma carbonic anhydrase family protein [Erysipelotrichaceae bacterium]|nr:gamma carbonic anhydrase family protein [Erysipelotrichaceae bacterium]
MSNIKAFNGKFPRIHPTAFIHPTAVIVGDVEIGEHVSVWPYAVIRGDGQPIIIKAYANIQDHVMIHVSPVHSAIVEEYVTVGHRAIIHACHIKHDVIVGMGSTILDGAVVQEESIVGANALISPGKVFPPQSMILGMPATKTRDLCEKDITMIRDNAMHYAEVKEHYRD